MRQRAQNIIVLTRSAWQTPTGRDTSAWSPHPEHAQMAQRATLHALHVLPRQAGSSAQPLNG
jgi:hypothetical protein